MHLNFCSQQCIAQSGASPHFISYLLIYSEECSISSTVVFIFSVDSNLYNNYVVHNFTASGIYRSIYSE